MNDGVTQRSMKREAPERARDAGAVNGGRDHSISVADLHKTYETRDGTVDAVRGATFDVKAGEFVSLVGPSGCGKSTILQICAGLVPPTRGKVEVGGVRARPGRREIGIMFQAPVLLPWRSVCDNVLLPTEIFRIDKGPARQRALELLDLVGLSGFEHTYPRHLSGGMQQRVALARLLMVGVDVLLLDEPFAAVDQLTRERLNMELLDVHERTSATAVLVTHNITEAVLLADRVIVMTPRPGRIADVLDVPFERPRVPEMAAEREFQELVLRAHRGLHAPGDEDVATEEEAPHGA